LSVFIFLAPVEAVVDDEAIVIFGVAPAVLHPMRAKIVDGTDVVSDDLPGVLSAGFSGHGFLRI
jgi:hypothetical protein